MKRSASSWTSGFIAIVSILAAINAAAGAAVEVKLEGRAFTLPAGFSIERIAGPPFVDRPITAAFDVDGCLYVADSSGSNDNVKRQLAEKPHRIVRLEDSDGDGRFDKRTVFADKMMFPEGTMWYDGSLYVAAPPSIWKLTDTNGDGVADQRVEWFAGKTLTGCANDLHGPYLGLDGWIYWCKGAFAQQGYERPGKSPFVTRAAHIFRCRPDGTGIEPVMTGGMDNPVDVVFTPGGERIFTTTFLVNPSGGQRDGLIHAIYGGMYGKVHDPIFDSSHKWTAPQVMPVLLHMGPAALCGLTRYESDAFGKDYEDNLFACYFNLHKVSRHVLVSQGASFTTKDEDFVSSSDLDFHPTDVLEDADGSLVIVDTGGWYKLCCPTSQLHKPDVLGAVYRVKRVGMAKTTDPRGKELWKRFREHPSRASDQESLKLLGDPRPAVQHRMIEHLSRSDHKDANLGVLRSAADDAQAGPRLRRNVVWTLARIDDPRARSMVEMFFDDPDETVRQAAIHVTSLWRDRCTSRLSGLLKSSSAHNRRAAAEALGRVGDRSAVPALLAAAGAADDRIIEHSITYALIEIGDPMGTAAGLLSTNPRTLRAALVALDQLDGGSLTPKFVAGMLARTEPALKETAVWIIGRHPEWAEPLADFFALRLMQTDLPPADRSELERQLGRFAARPPIQRLLAARLRDASLPAIVRRSSLQAMAWSSLKPEAVPRIWIDAIASLLAEKPSQPELVSQGVATLGALPLPTENAGALALQLLPIAADAKNADDLRLDALAAVPGGLDKPDRNLFTFLISQLDRHRPVAERTTAADVLARRLTAEQLGVVADTVPTAGPLEVDRLLVAFEQTSDESIGLKLVRSLTTSTALSSLRIDSIKPHLKKYGPNVQKEAERLYARLNVGAASQRARLEELVTTLRAGDVRRGQLIFHSEKAACYSCHAIGYRGGNIGPDLTRIGSVRADRDLLEAIVFPSASFVRSFEPIAVATGDGKIFNGLLRGETADELVLATGVNQEVRIPRRDIEEMRPSSVSLMPAGLDQQLSPQELADLVAFLKACN